MKHRTQKEIREETQRRKAEGTSGTYPTGAKKTPVSPGPKPLPVTSGSTTGAAPFKLNEGDCKFLGKKATGEKCNSGIYVCNHFKENTARFVKCSKLNHHCPTCPAFEKSDFNPLAEHFNASIFTWKGRNYVLSRKGWSGSNIYLTEVGKDFQLVEGLSFPRVLGLFHDSSRAGREDPRFFTSHGMPFIAFAGVQVGKGRTKVNQLYAELDGNLRVVKVTEPVYPARTPVEKNWSFFDYNGITHSIYSVSPHVVLRHDNEKTEKVADVGWFPPWTGKGHMRGGASPVRVNDEYYHFFHGMNWRPNSARPYKEYTVGLYTFSARPPFAPVRGPVLVVDAPPYRPDYGLSVAFPGGAVKRGGDWFVSYGYNDTSYEVIRLDAAELERRLNAEPEHSKRLKFDPFAIAPLPGWCSLDKALSCADLVARGGIKTACEIGVFGGRWSIAVALALKARNEGGKLYCVDAWDLSKDTYTDDPEYVKFWSGADMNQPRAAFFAAIKQHGLESIIEVIETDSRTGAPRVPDGLDLLHIDGCHDRDNSCHDARIYGAKVKRGGWIAFDDSHWDSVQDALSILSIDCGLDRDFRTWRLYRKL